MDAIPPSLFDQGAPPPRRSDAMAWWPMRALVARRFDAATATVWAVWLGLSALSVALAFLEARLDWSGIPVPVGTRHLGVSIYPPVAIAALLAFWLGPTYGAGTAYVSTLVSGLAGGLAADRAALFALGTPAELLLLWFLALMLRVRPGLHAYRDWWRFGAAAMIATTASSLDIMLYNEAHRLPIADGQRLWEGWIFGDLAQLCLVVAPLLWWGWERAHRVAAARLGAPRRELSARNTVLLLGFVWATLAGLAMLGIRLLTRALDIPDGAVTVSGERLLPRLGEMATFLVVLVGALLLSTMALTAALAGRGEQSAALSLRDDLTGAYNRRAFAEFFEREEARSRAAERPLSLVCFDLDRFKAINDRNGHAAGDRVLVGVVAAARQRLRKHDLLFRWGGDEFLILLPHTTAEEAAALGERLRESIAATVVADLPGVTASVGVAAAAAGTASADDLVRLADDAVYRAKALGGDRVVTPAPVRG
jgi:diguanylate cyclase (GGDEF)-like protein